MAGIKDLSILLKSMSPELVSGEYVFCTVSDSFFSKLKEKPLLFFQEKEGITLILKKEGADMLSLKYEGTYAWIILTVYSDLAAVGFLAMITKPLAEAGISVNAISAYYHDHLFVPSKRAKDAMMILKRLQQNQK